MDAREHTMWYSSRPITVVVAINFSLLQHHEVPASTLMHAGVHAWDFDFTALLLLTGQHKDLFALQYLTAFHH